MKAGYLDDASNAFHLTYSVLLQKASPEISHVSDQVFIREQ
jgi:hypothetical protein